jgi:hypothetical protein
MSSRARYWKRKARQIGAVDSLYAESDNWWSGHSRGNDADAPRRRRGCGRVLVFLDQIARKTKGAVATVGTIVFEPNAINVIPSVAIFSVDLRNPNDERLQSQEAALEEFLDVLRGDGFG